MIKFNNFAYMSAIALIGAVGFTACSSDDDITNPNPTFDGETVKTQFTINVPAGGQGTRLGSDIVQDGESADFRGIGNINMFAFKLGGGNDSTVVLTSTIQQKYLGMGGIAAENGLQTGTNAKVYYDMDIPTGVNHFLFYGEATRAQGTTDAVNGRLNATYPDAESNLVSEIKFELQTINEDGNTTTENTLLNALNTVVGSNVQGSPDVSYWYESDDAGLKNLYQAFTQLKAGSANSIREALIYLKEGLNNEAFKISDTDLKNAILNNIKLAVGDDGNEGTLKDLTYPRDLGLPDGAVELSYNETNHQFSYVKVEDVGSSEIIGASAAKLSDYVYPASLYYWTNSPILVSDEVQSDNYGTTGYTNWENVLNLYGGYTKTGSVETTTRSVALRNKIQYAVARLALSAWFNVNGGTVKDNVGNDIDVNKDEGGMNIVGLLVGGQKSVKFDFSTPIDEAKEKSVYDMSITPTALGESTSSDIIAHSLLLETAQGEKVRFAIELENQTGESFVGQDGTVPAGGRFYLIGELKPSTEVEGMENRVFKQDFITTAKVTINSLANAYNCIPDLRSPRLELGLSVDLEWQEGLVDNVTIE